jgi:hypothetical protein
MRNSLKFVHADVARYPYWAGAFHLSQLNLACNSRAYSSVAYGCIGPDKHFKTRQVA